MTDKPTPRWATVAAILFVALLLLFCTGLAALTLYALYNKVTS